MLRIAEQIILAEKYGFSEIVVPITEAKQLLANDLDYQKVLEALAGTENITKGSQVPEK